MLDFRDKKMPDQWDRSGEVKRARVIQRC